MFFRNSVRRKSIFGALLKSISIPHFQRFVRRHSLFRSFLQIGFFLNERFWDFVCKEKTAFFKHTTPNQEHSRAVLCKDRLCSLSYTTPLRSPAGPSGRLDLLLNLRQCLPKEEDLLGSLMIFVMSHSLQSVCPANSQKRALTSYFQKETLAFSLFLSGLF